MTCIYIVTLTWHKRRGFSNHRHLAICSTNMVLHQDENSEVDITGVLWRNPLVGSPPKWPVIRKAFPYHDVSMSGDRCHCLNSLVAPDIWMTFYEIGVKYDTKHDNEAVWSIRHSRIHIMLKASIEWMHCSISLQRRHSVMAPRNSSLQSSVSFSLLAKMCLLVWRCVCPSVCVSVCIHGRIKDQV